MAKKGYISAIYPKEKPGMRGQSAGTLSLPDEELQRKRLINTIKGNADLDAAYRRWQLGEKDMETKKYDYEPLNLGRFEDFAEQYNSQEAQAKRKALRNKMTQPFAKREDYDLDFCRHHSPELLTKDDLAHCLARGLRIHDPITGSMVLVNPNMVKESKSPKKEKIVEVYHEGETHEGPERAPRQFHKLTIKQLKNDPNRHRDVTTINKKPKTIIIKSKPTEDAVLDRVATLLPQAEYAKYKMLKDVNEKTSFLRHAGKL